MSTNNQDHTQEEASGRNDQMDNNDGGSSSSSAMSEMELLLNDEHIIDDTESERRENVRRQYRRRLTIDPLSDVLIERDLQRMAEGLVDEESGEDVMNDGVENIEAIVDAAQADRPNENHDEFIQLLFRQGVDNLERETEQVDNEPHRPARDHAYLPTPQPLYPEEWLSAGRHRLRQQSGINDSGYSEESVSIHEQSTNNNDGNTYCKIPPPPGLFPSITTSTSTSQNDASTLPILELDNVVLFPGSTLPLRFNDSRWVDYLGNLIDDARGLYGVHANNEVRIGIISKIVRRTRRQPMDAGARTGRWRVDLIRRGLVSIRRRPRAARGNNDTDGAGGSSDDTLRDEPRSEHDNQAEAAAEQQNETDETSAHDIDESDEDNMFHAIPSRTRSIQQTDPLIGRIGTIATIIFTHEEIANPVEVSSNRNQVGRQSSMVWRRHTAEVVVTAVGTTRFRIVRSSEDEDAATPGPRRSVPLYEVEEISDGNVSFPHNWAQRPGDLRSPVFTSLPMNDADEKSEESDPEEGVSRASECKNSLDHNNHSIHNLSIQSAIPEIAYRSLWPWRISQQICTALQGTESFQGIYSALPTAAGVQTINDAHGTYVQVIDNSAFANWLGANLPLDQNDRLDILEMRHVVQQLLFILKKLQKMATPLLRCKYCGTVIAEMSNVFTVGGAEGTTGAYVNEYGVVHQTVTVREVDPQGIVAVGYSETKDSWFPGYAWTISYCRLCHSHLGWKFNRRKRSSDTQEAEENRDRPPIFWGLSAVTSERNIEPRRLGGRNNTSTSLTIDTF